MSKLISVTDFCLKYKKDPGNVRRMIQKGRIKGYKIGNQWVIDDMEPYPDDNRITNGNYINYRNKNKIFKDINLKNNINKMIEELVEAFSSNLDRIVLYGSYSRGEQTDDSDVDIAIILKDEVENVTDIIVDCVYKYEVQSGKIISVIDINKNKFDEWHDTIPFYKNIMTDGIVLWKSE